MTNELVTFYDKYFDFGLRSEPYFRTVVDKRPVNVTNPGESVVFNFYSDLAVSTTPLTENVDPDGVALSNTTQVTVTLNEYGNKIEDSLRLRVDALNDVDAAGINQLAYNCRNSLDSLVQTKMATATQLGVRAAGAWSTTDYTGAGTAANVNTITAGDAITSGDIRRIVATLRQNNVVPKVNNGSYVGFIHPQVSADLRAETGAAAWRDPSEDYALAA
jgi:N4-gp56 family major capsid protein